MSNKHVLEKEEIETLKRAIEILDDITCDECIDSIKEIISINIARIQWEQCVKEANNDLEKARDLYAKM